MTTHEVAHRSENLIGSIIAIALFIAILVIAQTRDEADEQVVRAHAEWVRTGGAARPEAECTLSKVGDECTIKW